MPFYLGALRMLNIATRYSKNTLSWSELSEEHAGEGFRSLFCDTYLRRYERVKQKNVTFRENLTFDLT